MICALSGALLASLPLTHLDARPQRVDIPAGKLPSALVDLSRQTGISIGMEGDIPDRPSPGVHGMMEPDAALARLLRGSNLVAVHADGGVWRLEPRAAVPRRPMPPASEASEDIIVSATKRDLLLSRAPIDISIIRPGMAEAMVAQRGVHDAVVTSAGAFTTNLGPGRDRIFLRGVADSPFNGPTQSTVNIDLDDARVSYATPDPDLRLVDIDQIEILRGPQGTLYGSGALGGIVRIVPRKPDLDRWSGMAAIEGNLVAHGGAGGGVEAVVNAPFVPGRLALRWVGYADSTAGWIDDSRRRRSNVNRARRYGTRATLGWEPADGWRADLGLVAQWLNVSDSQYAFRRLSRATAVAEPHDNDFLAATLRVHGMIGSLDFLSSTAMVTHEFGNVADATTEAPARGLPAPLGYRDERQLRLLTQELRISDGTSSRPWVAGITALQAINRVDTAFEPVSAPALPLLTLRDDTLELALFGEVTQPLGPRWSVTAGVRAYHARSDNEQPRQARRRTRKSGLTPSVTLSWRPAEHGLLWLRYASAVRPGGINPDGDPRAPAFRSDELSSLELGWRLHLLDRRLQFRGTLFGLDWENVQSDALGNDNLIRTINAGKARNYGAELAAELKIAPFTVEANLTVQHGRLYRPSAAANAVGDDSRLPILPDHAGGVRLAIDEDVRGVAVHAFLGARWLGASRLSFDSTLDRPMGDYWLSDAGMTAQLRDWTLGLTISNLLDQRENSFGYGNPFTLRRIAQRTPLQPRTLTVRVQKSF